MRPTDEQLAALLRLWNEAYGRDHGGARRIQRFLLGLYNGRRFPFDLTDFRGLDLGLFEACLQVLVMDSSPAMEVHEQLAIVLGKRALWVQLAMERWAYDQGLKGRAKKGDIDHLQERVKRDAQVATC